MTGFLITLAVLFVIMTTVILIDRADRNRRNRKLADRPVQGREERLMQLEAAGIECAEMGADLWDQLEKACHIHPGKSRLEDVVTEYFGPGLPVNGDAFRFSEWLANQLPKSYWDEHKIKGGTIREIISSIILINTEAGEARLQDRRTPRGFECD